MQLINKSDLLAPGVCVLCESSPSDEVKIVDTLKNLVTGFPFQLAGRKYVCEACTNALGAVVGLTPDTVQKEAERRLADAEARLVAIGGFLDGLAKEIQDGKFAEVTQVVAVADEDVRSGLEAAVEAGTDPGAVSIAGAASAEPDAQPVSAAEVDAAFAKESPPTFDPSLIPGTPEAAPAKTERKKTKDEVAAEHVKPAATRDR